MVFYPTQVTFKPKDLPKFLHDVTPGKQVVYHKPEEGASPNDERIVTWILLKKADARKVNKPELAGKPIKLIFTAEQLINQMLLSDEEIPLVGRGAKPGHFITGGSWFSRAWKAIKRVGGKVFKVLQPWIKGASKALGVDDLVSAVSGAIGSIPGAEGVARTIDSAYNSVTGTNDASIPARDPSSAIRQATQTATDVSQGIQRLKPKISIVKNNAVQLADQANQAADQIKQQISAVAAPAAYSGSGMMVFKNGKIRMQRARGMHGGGPFLPQDIR